MYRNALSGEITNIELPNFDRYQSWYREGGYTRSGHMEELALITLPFAIEVSKSYKE